MNHPLQRQTVDLPEVLDLKAAAPLARELLALRGTPLAINASSVRRIGGLCLQVLLSARLTWTADNVPIHIVNASKIFADGLAVSGAAQSMMNGVR